MGEHENQPIILLTGAGGLLGRRLVQALAGRRVVRHYHRRPAEAASGDISVGDLGGLAQVETLAQQVAPQVIINCAAMADVDRCEADNGLSRAANVAAVKNLVRSFSGVRFIQISTDYVFSDDDRRGEAAPRPHDVPNPINVYGRHKLEAEYITLAASPRNLVIRVNSLFDHQGRTNIFSHTYDGLSAGKTIYGMVDQISNPIYALSAAELIAKLDENDAVGIFHVGGREMMSRYDFARRIAAYFGFNADLVKSSSTDKQPRPSARPKRAGLDCRMTEAFLKTSMPDVDGGFARISREMRPPAG